jgi:beta-N-acetylhexosaminidase
VGGVVLLTENGNFSDAEALAVQVYRLTADLQRAAAGVSPPPEGSDSLAATPQPSGSYVPLFIGLEERGQDWPYSELLSDLTPVASNMAIGATWNPAYAELTGEIVGRELSSLGINLLLGPSADVVEVPQPFTGGNLGTRTFGGEPFWVAQMVSAFVRGAHSGSDSRLAVVPRHFPGYGGADRLASVEIPTVRRSQDQLAQVDLVPFFAITGQAADPLGAADGLLVGHIQYQGFGENLRGITRPITVDQAALQSLMALEPIATWREAGGLLISDSLSLGGMRHYYDPQDTLFPGRRIAREAFAAGNDILYLGNFGASPATQMDEVLDVLDFFAQRYDAEPAFREQVDASVRRIIRAKLDLYGDFEVENVIPDESGLSALGTRSEDTFEVASSALTLLPPQQPEPVSSPQRGDRFVIFTDTRAVRQCATCEPRPLIAIDALRGAILRAYGPDATGLVSLASVVPFSFDELDSFLDAAQAPPPVEAGQTPEPNQVQQVLSTADWVVFLSLDIDPDVPSSDVVKRFLALLPVSQGTQVVVMAMGAPYYLDSTEISKLTAYYALYGYSSPFVEVAARALFQELTPTGAPPVSVTAVDYEILRATSPDPAQIISLSYAADTGNGSQGVTATPPAEPLVEQGDTLRLTTGVILDRNGNPVPDGTPVDFILDFINEGLRDTQSHTTVGGVAQASVVLSRLGEMRISATSGEARNSTTITIAVRDSGEAEISVLAPEIPPTLTPTPTEEAAPIPTPTEQSPDGAQTDSSITPAAKLVSFSDLFLTLLGLTVIAGAVLLWGMVRHDLAFGLTLAVLATASGLLGYNYYALLLPGTQLWRGWLGDVWAASAAAWICAALGMLAVFGWQRVYGRWIVRALRERYRR